MLDLILITLCSLLSGLRGQAALQAENIALRHQVTVLQRTHTKRPILKPGDRCLWVWLSRLWSGWRSVLIIVMPDTSSAGILKDFVGIGLGKFGTERRDGLKFRNKSAI